MNFTVSAPDIFQGGRIGNHVEIMDGTAAVILLQ